MCCFGDFCGPCSSSFVVMFTSGLLIILFLHAVEIGLNLEAYTLFMEGGREIERGRDGRN